MKTTGKQPKQKSNTFKQKIASIVLAATLVSSCLPFSAFASDGSLNNASANLQPENEVSLLASSETVGLDVEGPTQDQIRDYVSSRNLLEKQTASFSVEPSLESPYKAGKLTDETQQNTIDVLNSIRYIAGLSDDVEYSASMAKQAQAASLVNFLNGTNSHYPEKPEGMSDDLYSLAYKGANNSNLLRASSTRSIFDMLQVYMYDSDSSNLKNLGHRRWILSPNLKHTALGFVCETKEGQASSIAFSALCMIDPSAPQGNVEKYVAWPAQQTPVEYFNYNPTTAAAWSVSTGKELDESKIRVYLIRQSDLTEWVFSASHSDGDFYISNKSYGQKGCIIFRPDGIAEYEAGEKFLVRITGLGETLEYDVEFFSLTEEGKARGHIEQADIKVSNEPTYTGSAVFPDVTVTLEGQELVEGSDYQIEYEDSFTAGVKTLTVKGLGHYVGEKATTYSIKSLNLNKAATEIYVKQDAQKKNHIITKVICNDLEMSEETDYKITQQSGEPAVIKGVGNFTGQIECPYCTSSTHCFSKLPEESGSGSQDSGSQNSGTQVPESGSGTGSQGSTGGQTGSGTQNPGTVQPEVVQVTDVFVDVAKNAWYVEHIQWVYDNGVMSGYADGSCRFGVGDTLKRSEFAMLLANYVGADVSSRKDTTGISDLAAGGKWYTGACNWAVESGIITGYTDKKGNVTAFGPNDPVTREQAMVILYRFAQSHNVVEFADLNQLSKYSDGKKVSVWAKSAVAWMLEKEIVSGRKDDGVATIAPKEYVQREEIAKITHNTVNLIEASK